MPPGPIRHADIKICTAKSYTSTGPCFAGIEREEQLARWLRHGGRFNPRRTRFFWPLVSGG
jgi:hypothetical protein